MTAVLTLEQAEDLAACTLAAIAIADLPVTRGHHYAADRERVASDLAGLRECYRSDGTPLRGPRHVGHARRYSESLVRTAALYGQTP